MKSEWSNTCDLDLTLRLWKVNLPFHDALKQTLKSLKLYYDKQLPSIDGMLKVFDSPPQCEDLYIVI